MFQSLSPSKGAGLLRAGRCRLGPVRLAAATRDIPQEQTPLAPVSALPPAPVSVPAASSSRELASVAASSLETPSTSRDLLSWLTTSAPVRAYLRQLEAHPLQTKCWTSFSGFFLGDVAAQLLTEPSFAIERTLILATYGFIIDAPAGNAFYNWLDANIEPGNARSGSAVGKKIVIDQLLYAPIFTCVLYSFLQLAHMDPASIPAVLQDKVVPTLMANYAVWPLAHALNFYYVPTEQRILYNNFVAVCWTTWLSYIAH